MPILDIEKVNERFCRDYGVKIKIFTSPYFEQRLKLSGKEKEYNDFISLLENDFDGDIEKFLTYIREVRENIVNYILESETYKWFNSIDLNAKSSCIVDSSFIVKSNVGSTDVYFDVSVGHKFIAFDMSKANFSVFAKLSQLSKTTFANTSSYEDFMRKFTPYDYIINSKSFRQSVFGKCNSSRQGTFEKYFTNMFATKLIEKAGLDSSIMIRLRDDEVIFDADNLSIDDIKRISSIYKSVVEMIGVSFDMEYYELGKIIGLSRTYIKKVFDENGEVIKLKPKNVEATMYHFVQKMIIGEDFTDDDLIFVLDGRLGKFVDTPKLYISYDRIKVN